MQFAVFVILACGLAFVEPSTFKKGKMEEKGCEEMFECVTLMEKMFLQNMGVSGSMIISEEYMDDFCKTSMELDTCVKKLHTKCHKDAMMADIFTIIDASEYVCSEKGKQEIMSLSDTECISDEKKKMEVDQVLQKCMVQFQLNVLLHMFDHLSKDMKLEPSDYCLYRDMWVDCSTKVVEKMCGQEYGKVMGKILTHSTGSKFEMMGCPAVMISRRNVPFRRMMI